MSPVSSQILEAVESMPAFPKSVQHVLSMASDTNCTPKELVDVIKNDPIFTMKILRVVNSPFVGLSNEITSIHQASVYLGTNTLKNIALSLACIGALPSVNNAGFNMTEFWLHSLAVAVITQRLAERLQVPRCELSDYFSAGLLHDVGKIVLALYMAESFKHALDKARADECGLWEAEDQLFQANHAEVGALLAKKWDFPTSLYDGIRHHHAPILSQKHPVIDCVFTADQVCKALDYGNSGDPLSQELPPSVQERFSTDLYGVIRSIPDLQNELEKAKIFITA